MYSARLMELFHSRVHAGDLGEATHEAQAGVLGAGPYMRLRFRAENGTIRAARFKTYGCPAAIGCAEAACAWSEGRALSELQHVSAEQVRGWVDGVPEGKEHCPALAAAALNVTAPVEPSGS